MTATYGPNRHVVTAGIGGSGPQAASALRARLADWWMRTEMIPAPPQILALATHREARTYWWRTARAETIAYLRWCARGRPPYTQADSREMYRTVADVYPDAARRRVTVLIDGRVAIAPLLTFKRLTLEPLLDLIDRERITSVLDFGCGWGVNTILLRQLRPAVKIWSFDVSPERVLVTKFNLDRLALPASRLFVADGSRLPLPEAAVDLVLSTHVLEQMNEILQPALTEIHRVARRFAVHVEPSYRFARWPHRLRMRRLGYPRDIAERALQLGWSLVEHRPARPAWGGAPGELIVLKK